MADAAPEVSEASPVLDSEVKVDDSQLTATESTEPAEHDANALEVNAESSPSEEQPADVAPEEVVPEAPKVATKPSLSYRYFSPYFIQMGVLALVLRRKFLTTNYPILNLLDFLSSRRCLIDSAGSMHHLALLHHVATIFII
jgi:hypothetical protein